MSVLSSRMYGSMAISISSSSLRQYAEPRTLLLPLKHSRQQQPANRNDRHIQRTTIARGLVEAQTTAYTAHMVCFARMVIGDIFGSQTRPTRAAVPSPPFVSPLTVRRRHGDKPAIAAHANPTVAWKLCRKSPHRCWTTSRVYQGCPAHTGGIPFQIGGR
jgi:hypothetical protein